MNVRSKNLPVVRSLFSAWGFEPSTGVVFKILIKFILLVCFFTIPLISCQQEPNYQKEIAPYVSFLDKKHDTAKDYVLKLFESKDIVILSERDHREDTQYDFFKELMSDPRFIQNVGQVFTEVGMRNLNPKINQFVHSSGLSDKEKTQQLIDFQRRCSFYPIWSKYGFYRQIQDIYEINQNLPDEAKINIYPSDVAFDLDAMSIDYLKQFWNTTVDKRDSLIADYIIQQFERIQASESERKKILVIMNFRHAFNHHFKQANGDKFDNVGRFLFEKFPQKTANVLINPLKLKRKSDTLWSALQDGKWDAAFKVKNIDNLGFDFKDSPFGLAQFDYWSFFPHNYNYQDIYTGLVYYQHPSDFKIITGINKLIDSSFIDTYKNRVRLWQKAIGSFQNSSLNDSIIYQSLSFQHSSSKEHIDLVACQIDQWIVTD